MMDRNMNLNTNTRCPMMDSPNDCANQVVGMAYVPWQTFGQTYDPKKALMVGTIFPELDMPFTGRCSIGGRCR